MPAQHTEQASQDGDCLKGLSAAEGLLPGSRDCENLSLLDTYNLCGEVLEWPKRAAC